MGLGRDSRNSAAQLPTSLAHSGLEFNREELSIHDGAPRFSPIHGSTNTLVRRNSLKLGAFKIRVCGLILSAYAGGFGVNAVLFPAPLLTSLLLCC